MTFNTKSLPSAAQMRLKQYADAEPLLRAGEEGMEQREKSIPPRGKLRISEAFERLVQYRRNDGQERRGRQVAEGTRCV